MVNSHQETFAFLSLPFPICPNHRICDQVTKSCLFLKKKMFKNFPRAQLLHLARYRQLHFAFSNNFKSLLVKFLLARLESSHNSRILNQKMFI